MAALVFVGTLGVESMSNWGEVVFPCRKCGKSITRSSTKRGELFSCGACQKVQRTPGIAQQPQATEAQLTVIRREFRLHVLGLIVAPCVVVLSIVLIPVALLVASRLPSGSDAAKFIGISPVLLAQIGVFFLLCMELGSIECLGGTATASFVLLFIFWPIWLLWSISSIIRVHFHFKRLAKAGPRSQGIRTNPLCIKP